MKIDNEIDFSNTSFYKLIDVGNFEKLEKFGNYYLIRPEPQAIWQRKKSNEEWKNLAHAHYIRNEQKTSYRNSESNANGGWKFYKKTPENWIISIIEKNYKLNVKIALTSFGHIGIFPEQLTNWNFIFNTIKSLNIENPTVLNSFAYTGVASVVAKIAGANVTHLDAVKPIVLWAKENMENSKQTDIRWIVEDATKYFKREEKRGKKYNGIILDPPAYGRGPTGEKWILEDDINELLHTASKILMPNNAFLILNLYSLGFSPYIASNLIDSHFKYTKKEFGELILKSETEFNLPLGNFARITR